MSLPILVSAPGKVILHGEHAVVYGKAALAASVDLRCYLLLLPKEDGTVVLELPDIQLLESWKMSELAQCLLPSQEAQLDVLRRLSGIGPNVETPSTQSVATLAFLFLLTNIYREKLRELAGLHVTAVATLPASAGLGSSAAYSVCLAASLLSSLGSIGQTTKLSSGTAETSIPSELPSSTAGSPSSDHLPEIILQRLEEFGHPQVSSSLCTESWSQQELETINKWGFEAEKLIHGTPSGIDNSISTFGGAINFKAGSITPLKRMPSVQILLVNTKVPRSTKKMVASVREKYEKFPEIIDPVLNSIEAIAIRAQTLLEDMAPVSPGSEPCSHTVPLNHTTLQELFVLNHSLLNTIGVGHPALEQVCNIAQGFGLAAKLTGGGGGGCAIVLVPPGFPESKLREVKTSLTESGFDCWKTVIGTKGVSQH